MNNDDITDRRRNTIEQLEGASANADEAYDSLVKLLAHLQDQLFPHGWSLERPMAIAADDPRLRVLFDALAAMAVLAPDDPAIPWERGGLLSAFGRHLEAAEDYLTAARLFRGEADAGGAGLTGDEADWAMSALFHAAKNLARGGQPIAAAALLPQLDSHDRAEVESLVSAKSAETIL
jgi:hypothetical protein